MQPPDGRDRRLGLGRRQAGDLVAEHRVAHVLEQQHEAVVVHVELGVEQARRADRRVLRKLRVEGHLARIEEQHAGDAEVGRVGGRKLADDSRGGALFGLVVGDREPRDLGHDADAQSEIGGADVGDPGFRQHIVAAHHAVEPFGLHGGRVVWPASHVRSTPIFVVVWIIIVAKGLPSQAETSAGNSVALHLSADPAFASSAGGRRETLRETRTQAACFRFGQ